MVRIEPKGLQLVVIFEWGGSARAFAVHPIAKPEDYRDALLLAYDRFHEEMPRASLLDVKISFDKID